MAMKIMNEYEKRRPNICKFPFSGVTINPNGDFVPCCGASGVKLGHISEESSLEEYINGDAQEILRDDFKKGKWPVSCNRCKTNRDKGLPALIDFMGDQLPWSDENFLNDKYDVQYLEFTPSNACNASCSTCGSLFSSKWKALDNKALEQGLDFRKSTSRVTGKNYSISDIDFDKILESLPTVKRLMLKGGEPLADKRNIILLEKIRKEKLTCHIDLITNFSMMDDEILDILKDISNIHVSVSMDGLGKQYNWIRSTDFDHVISNIEKYHEVTNKKVTIIITLSVYNFFNIEEAIKFFTAMKSIYQIQLLSAKNPIYVSPSMIPQHMMEKLNDKHETSLWISENPKVKKKNELLDYTSLESLDDKSWFLNNKEPLMKWIDFLNQERGFRIEDLVPEINEIRRYYEDCSS
jgi:radical SAM protein with 4Fe4S-binding SPASM domain